MKTLHSSFGVIILYFICLIFAKPIGYDKSVSDDNLHCVDLNAAPEYERNTPSSFSDFYKSHSRYEGLERYPNRIFDYDKKRSLSDELENVEGGSIQKRQVGVVYKDDKPIGILQPFQRSYRFIPVNDESSYGFGINELPDIASYNTPNVGSVDKREINLGPAQNLEASYPSILTNFKIVNKLDRKRNYDALTDDNVRDLKETIRQLRSPNTHNTEQIEEELKNILDDMGLIDDEEIHAEKREIAENQRDDDDDETLIDDKVKSALEDRSKRDELFSFNNEDLSNKVGGGNEYDLLAGNEVKSQNALISDKRETSNEDNRPNRKKRQQSMIPSRTNKKNLELVESLKDSADLTMNENKPPLVSKPEIIAKNTVSDESEAKSSKNIENDYEKRVERQIQSKINSLKEEVKREIESLKKKQNEDDTQRKKRQITENLVDEETDQLNPLINLDENLKPLVRKRRTINTSQLNISSSGNLKRQKRATNIPGSRNKRSEHSIDVNNNNQKNYKARQDDGDEGGELLGDDFEQKALLKRHIFNAEQYTDLDNENLNLNDAMYSRNKRSHVAANSDFYDNFQYNHYDEDDEKSKRQNMDANDDYPEKIKSDPFVSLRSMRLTPRLRRRINEDGVMANRPQQLSDMSDLDLFGALPKSYEGELSRYKRVK